MPEMLLIVATSLSVIAAIFSVLSLALHYRARNEHPDVASLRAEVMDVLDKVEHWIKRDRVRRLRASKEDPAEPLPQSPADRKAALRQRVFGGNVQ